MRTEGADKRPEYSGTWIALFGPDGAGKSAVIEQVSAQLGPVFQGVSQFHFRPHFAGKALSRPPVTNPHAQTPRGLLISIAKLIYWLVDCWYGYVVFICPNRRRSRLVISDRYYPDILIDPRRYRLPASSLRLAKWLCSLAPRPDLRILLDAPAEVVQNRKAEVSVAESERQRRAYLRMFESVPRSRVINANCFLQAVAEEVSAAVLASALNVPPQQPDVLVNADS